MTSIGEIGQAIKYRLNKERVRLWRLGDWAIWGLPESGGVEYSRA
jgi:hypothetical protein